MALAHRNNPAFQMQRNDEGPADWAVREAYGSLLPGVSASGSLGYTEAGVQRIGTLDFGAQSTDWYSSTYRLALGWTLDGGTFFGVPNARAARRATTARIDAQAFELESTVTLQYMAALRARDGVGVARRQLERAEENLELVRARVQAGAAAGTDGRQASVDRGRAEVALIEAEQALRAEKLLLMERIGLRLEEDVELVDELTVFEPRWGREELLDAALDAHPSLRAWVAQERAGRAAVRQARSQYFPSLSVTTGFSGNALEARNETFLVDQAELSALRGWESCRRWKIIQDGLGTTLPGLGDPTEGCGSPSLSAGARERLLASNRVFPFDFTKNPLSLNLTLSVPVFNGFARERRVEAALADADDARHQRRAEELRLRTAVTRAHDALAAAWRIVAIEEDNRGLAAERLELARQRYAIGAAPSSGSGASGSSYLELLDALASSSTAERDYLDAVYAFHQALAQLEAATGRRLRPDAPLQP